MRILALYILNLLTSNLLPFILEDEFDIKEQLRNLAPFVCYLQNGMLRTKVKMFMFNSFNSPKHNSVYIKGVYSFVLIAEAQTEKTQKEPTEQGTFEATEQNTRDQVEVYEPTRESSITYPVMSNMRYKELNLDVVTTVDRNRRRRRNGRRRSIDGEWVRIKFDDLQVDLMNIKDNCNARRCFLNLEDTEVLMHSIRPVGETWGCEKLSTEFGFYWYLDTASKFSDEEIK